MRGLPTHLIRGVLLVMAVLLVVGGTSGCKGTALEGLKQAIGSGAKAEKRRTPIQIHESKVSIIGDDSFVKARERQQSTNQNIEYLKLDGGYIAYHKLHAGWYFNHTNEGNRLTRNINKNQRYDISATSSDIQDRMSRNGNYYYISKGNDKINLAYPVNTLTHNM